MLVRITWTWNWIDEEWVSKSNANQYMSASVLFDMVINAWKIASTWHATDIIYICVYSSFASCIGSGTICVINLKHRKHRRDEKKEEEEEGKKITHRRQTANMKREQVYYANDGHPAAARFSLYYMHISQANRHTNKLILRQHLWKLPDQLYFFFSNYLQNLYENNKIYSVNVNFHFLIFYLIGLLTLFLCWKKKMKWIFVRKKKWWFSFSF